MADRVSYRNLLVGAYEYFQSDMLNKLVANQPKTHLQTITNQMKTKSINYGDIRLNNIRKYLDLFPGYTRCVLCYYLYYFSNCALTFFFFSTGRRCRRNFMNRFFRRWLYICTEMTPRYLTVITFYFIIIALN